MKVAVLLALLICALTATAERAQQNVPPRPFNVRSIPVGAWLDAGVTTEIPWKINVRSVSLRMDQRLEVTSDIHIGAKDLNRIGKTHQLVFLNRISTPDGEWLNEPAVIRHSLDQELPNNMETQFIIRVSVKPGDFFLWFILYDQVSHKHNVAMKRLRVGDIKNDPLPNAYARVPYAEFPEIGDPSDPVGYPSKLFLPANNANPLRIEIISTLSEPEQWAATGRNRGRIARSHRPNIVGALTALSQLELARGSLSITGLDLIRRETAFHQESSGSLDWKSLLAAISKATSPAVGVDALAGRKSNGAFFRDYLNERITSEGAGSKRVFIVVSETHIFANGADLKPLKLEGDCNCVVYHIRFRLAINDIFDELAKFIKPLHPKTFNVITPMEMRKAIAEILEDLKTL